MGPDTTPGTFKGENDAQQQLGKGTSWCKNLLHTRWEHVPGSWTCFLSPAWVCCSGLSHIREQCHLWSLSRPTSCHRLLRDKQQEIWRNDDLGTERTLMWELAFKMPGGTLPAGADDRAAVYSSRNLYVYNEQASKYGAKRGYPSRWSVTFSKRKHT